MASFIERFYEEVDDNLADPHSQKRLTRPQRLRDLHAVQFRIFERLLNLTGDQSSLGRAETTFNIEVGQTRYPLPHGFRNFLYLEKRSDDGDPDTVLDRLRSIATYDDGPGIEILDGQRGCLIKPTPDSSWAGTWVMGFRKGPVSLHYAAATSIGTRTIISGTPPADGGEVVLLDGYYNGSMIRVYQASRGAPQVLECVRSEVDGDRMVFMFDVPFDPVPTGEVWYEVCPEIPVDLDGLYAMDVALLNASRRKEIRLRAGLREERSELWNAVRNYFLSNRADSTPTRGRVPNDYEDDPYD